MRGGSLGLVLARAYADRAVVIVAWLVILATVTLLAASAIYAEAVGRSGLIARLARADIEAANIQVRTSIAPAEVTRADGIVAGELSAAIAPAGGVIHRFARSESFGLPDRPANAGELAMLAAADGLDQHARLVDGAWPAAGREPMEAAVSAAAADHLGLTVGDDLELTSRLRPDLRPQVRVVGIFEPLRPVSAYWWQDRLELDGRVSAGPFTTYGPLYVERDDLLERALAGRVTLIWRVEPNVAAIDGTMIGPIGGAVGRLGQRLSAQLSGATVEVQTGLPGLLARAGSSLEVSRAGILLLDLQLGLLGLYALVMLSALIIEQRRADTALLRSRGASGRQLTAYGLVEGTLMVLPAIALGPWLAMALIASFGQVGPLADIGVTISPRLTAEAVGLAAGAGLVSLVGLALPQVAATGPLAAVRRVIGRQVQRTVAQRMGLDLALLGLAALALWQLNQYGTPLTRSLRGTLGVDPLLVAAPMIGLLAGALLSLRVLPVLALAVERMLGRRRGPALAARQVARRPLRYTRAALLLIVAAAVTVFAGAYGATALRSQHDQVDYAVGADARLTLSSGGIDPETLAEALGRVEGVSGAMFVDRSGYRLGSAAVRGALLAVDAAGGAGIITHRSDMGPLPLPELLRLLRPAAAPAGGLVLPATARRLAVDVHAALLPAAAEGGPDALPSNWQGVTAQATLVDGSGLMYRVPGDGPLGAEGGRITFELPDRRPLGGSEPTPVAVAAIELTVGAPVTAGVVGEVALVGLAWAADEAGAQWQPLAKEPADWQATRRGPDGAALLLAPPEGQPGGIRLLADSPLPPATRATYGLHGPGVRSSTEEPLPALANPAFLAVSGLEIGDRVLLAEAFSIPRAVVVVDVVDGFPTLAPSAPLAVVDASALALADYVARGRLPEPNEAWISAPQADPRELRQALAETPLASGELRIAADELADRLTDPLTVGTAGALVLGTIAALLFAAVGFLVNAAVGVRERTVEFGLLRALGVSHRQLARALAVESAFLLGASMLLGTVLGVALAAIALPTATVTDQGTSPVPAALPVWPAEPLLVLLVLSAVLLVVAMLLFRRWLAATEMAALLRLRGE